MSKILCGQQTGHWVILSSRGGLSCTLVCPSIWGMVGTLWNVVAEFSGTCGGFCGKRLAAKDWDCPPPMAPAVQK